MRIPLLVMASLTRIAMAGEAPFVYPIWDQDNFVAQYEKAMALSQFALFVGGALVLLLVGLRRDMGLPSEG